MDLNSGRDKKIAARVAAAGLALLMVAPVTAAVAAATMTSRDEQGDVTTAVGSYLAAHHAEYMGDSEAAAEFLDRVLDEDQDNPELRRRLFVHLVSAGRVEDAVDLADSVDGGDQTSALAAITLAVAAARDSDYDAAAALLEEESPGSFGQIIVPMLSAWIGQGQGDTEAAVAKLDPLGEKEGFQLFRGFHRALIYDVAGDDEKADAEYATAYAGDDTPSYRLIEAYVSFLARHGQIEKAREIIDSVPVEQRNAMPIAAAAANLKHGADAERFVVTANDGLAEALFEVAAELRRENAPNIALFLGQLAVFVRPDFDIGHVLIAEILDDQDRIESAIASYDRVPDGSALGWQVRVRRAELLSDIGEVDHAIGLLEKMAGEQADRPEPLIRMGHIMRGEERFDEAVTAYDRAIDRISTFEPHHWGLLYARGIALERSKDWPRAEKDFLMALEFIPDQPYVLNYLGYSWVDQGINLERAREMIERAVELRPRDGYIVDSLGWALYRMGDFAGAVEHLETAVELRPEDPVINDHLGDAYWQVGREREARFQWKRALSLDPEEDQVEPIELKLENGLMVEEETERES